MNSPSLKPSCITAASPKKMSPKSWSAFTITTWFQRWWISILMLFFRSTEVEEPKDFRGTKGTLVKFEKCGFLDFRTK